MSLLSVLTWIYSVLAIACVVQVTRKRRIGFVFGLLSNAAMYSVVFIQPETIGFVLITTVYASVNIWGLTSERWKEDPWW